MAEKEFTLQHLETEEDVTQHLGLMRVVFGQDSRVDALVKKWLDHHPTMTLDDFFVVKHCGRTVACLNLIPSNWSIGGIPLKTSELGCVATLPEYRRLGLQRRLVDKYHERVSEQGYDLSAIEGIPYFYRQFGYEYALPLSEETRIELGQVPHYHSKQKIRPFTEKDVAKGRWLLAQAQRKFYVHTVRDENVWKMQRETGMVAEYKFEEYAVERDGEMIAYFRLDDNIQSKELMLREITDVDERTARSILGFLKEAGRQRELETLVATISHIEPFAEYLVSVGGMQNQPYAWQMRVTDYVKLFWKMKPLFEKRLATSSYCSLTERVNFNFYRYTIQIAFENGAMTDVRHLKTSEDRTIRSSPLVFVQLLLGYKNREELQTFYPDFLVKPSHAGLIDVLFPKMPSYIHTEY